MARSAPDDEDLLTALADGDEHALASLYDRFGTVAYRLARRVVVTPDMHRVHHSILPHETNSNFGFNLPWWDRLLGTYREQPREGHEGMTIGIEQFRTRRDLWIDRLLLQPFRGPASGYPINRDAAERDRDRHP